MVERQLPKLKVASSNLVIRFPENLEKSRFFLCFRSEHTFVLGVLGTALGTKNSKIKYDYDFRGSKCSNWSAAVRLTSAQNACIDLLSCPVVRVVNAPGWFSYRLQILLATWLLYGEDHEVEPSVNLGGQSKIFAIFALVYSGRGDDLFQYRKRTLLFPHPIYHPFGHDHAPIGHDRWLVQS